MLKYELFDYFDNQIQNIKRFKSLVKKRIRLNVEFKVRNID